MPDVFTGHSGLVETAQMNMVSCETQLSPRELEIARLYADGATYHEISRRLCIAPSTVRTHLSAIYRKLVVSSKLELRALLEGASQVPASEKDHAAIISELALSLEEAISREKAMAAVLRIISTSKGDINSVMLSILSYALELCDAEFGILFEHVSKGRFRPSFSKGIPSAFQKWMDETNLITPGPDTALGRMAIRHEIVNILDVRSEDLYQTGDPLRIATVDLGGARTFVAIPMMVGDALVGAFTIYRQRVRPFSKDTTALAQVFADQSVIAIENARMIGSLRNAPRTFKHG